MTKAPQLRGRWRRCYDPEKNPALKREIKFARRAQISDNIINRVSSSRSKATRLDFPIYDADFNGEAYLTVSGQNSNNSVRLTDDFFLCGREGRRVGARRRTERRGREAAEARDLWEQITVAAWRCADPGVQYDTTINDWHTCRVRRAHQRAATRARNTCSSTTRRAISRR